jgi:glucose-1-phosphatase
MNQTVSVPIDAVVFDIGRVLIDFSFERAFSAAAVHANLHPKEIRARLFGEGDFAGQDRERDVVEFECGRIDAKEFHARVERQLNCVFPYPSFVEAWNCIFTGEIEPTLEILNTLRQRGHVKVGILSNTNQLHMDYLRQRMPVFGELGHVYASHEIGCRKPDAESYHHVLKAMNVEPQRTVFIDDLPDNIEAARKVGMHAIHATHHDHVQAGLARLGVL